MSQPRLTPPTRMDAGSPSVEVIDPDRRLSAADQAWLQSHTVAALRLLDATGEVRIRIVADPAMAAAHESFARVPGTTDVLTFDMRENPDPASRLLDADILVCIDEAARQAGQRGHGVKEELLLYILHGILHCLGHDDHDPAAHIRMHAEEDRILSALGLGPVYSRGDHPGAAP